MFEFELSIVDEARCLRPTPEARLERLREIGDRAAILEARRVCRTYDLPIPPWAKRRRERALAPASRRDYAAAALAFRSGQDIRVIATALGSSIAFAEEWLDDSGPRGAAAHCRAIPTYSRG